MISPKTQHRTALFHLAVFGVVALAILITVLATNYIIDPRLTHQWASPSLDRMQSESEKQIPWGKTYAIFKYQPQVLYVGNSRTAVGLPADQKVFENKRVFNGALLGGRLWHDVAMLKHASLVTKLETVVWGVDYWSFTLDNGNSDFDSELVAFDQFYGLRRTLLDLKRSLSFDIAMDSLRIIFGNTMSVCRSNLVFHGQRDVSCEIANLVNRGGAAKALEADVRAVKDKNPQSVRAIGAFQSALQRLCEANVHVMIYINPQHAITLEGFYRQGHGSELESWKRQLADVVSKQRYVGCNAQLFDFSGFNSVTSETIPQVSGQVEMKNYWEGSHFREEVGRQVLARMTQSKTVPVPVDFGVEIDTGNVETHLVRIRSDRERYRDQHPRELALLDKWFESKPSRRAPSVNK